MDVCGLFLYPYQNLLQQIHLFIIYYEVSFKNAFSTSSNPYFIG